MKTWRGHLPTNTNLQFLDGVVQTATLHLVIAATFIQRFDRLFALGQQVAQRFVLVHFQPTEFVRRVQLSLWNEEKGRTVQ